MSTQNLSRTRNFVIFTFFVIVFFPTFWGYVSIGTGQLIYLIVSILGTIPVFLSLRAFKIPLPDVTPLFLLWSFSYLTTLVIQPILGHHIIPKDFTDALRPVIYLYFFILGFVFGKRLSLTKSFVNIIVILICVSLIFDIIKFFESFQLITKLYAVFEYGYLNYIRYSGTFGYCYNFGFVLIFIYCYCILSFPFKSFIFIGGCIAMLLVGSRSVLAAYMVVNIILFFTSSIPSYKKILIVPIIVLFIWVMYFIGTSWEIPVISDSIQYAERLYDTISGTAVDGSYDVRSSQKDKALLRFIESPIFGVGPTKDELPIEMQLGYYVSSWGICGLIIFIILQFCFFDSAIKGALSNKKDYLYKFSKSNAIWIISSFIVGMSTPITDQIRVFQIYFIIQGYQYAIANKNVSTSCSLFLIHKKIRKHPLK